MEPLYLKMFFDSEKGDLTLENIKTGITIPSINIGVLQKILVSCPPLEKQKEFAEKYKLKLDIIQSTTKRLEKLKDELKNLANLI